jgi:hypothetical protein
MPMKAFRRALALMLMLAPAASFATKIPIPIDGATLNVSAQFQPEIQTNFGASPDGTSPSFDVFARRTRLLVNGDISSNFTYLMQLDNANFGKFGNYSVRAIVQDAWVGWAPMGNTGGTVVFIDAGILLEPISHHLLESTTNFVTADVHTDSFRIPGNTFQGLRATGLQTRGWALDKKIGWRGGVFEGVSPFDTATPSINTGGSVVGGIPVTTPASTACTASGKASGTCITPKRNPQFAGFVNFDIIGSEEGGWLYGAYKWGDAPILSVGAAGVYQSKALLNGLGNLADAQLISFDVYGNLPMNGNELTFEATLYLNKNGTASANTGTGFFVDLGYRFGMIAPYFGYEYFQASDACDDSSLSAGQISTCKTVTQASNSRNVRTGFNFFFNKNFNHLNLEFQINHGQSAYGAQSMTVANAGYVPNINNGLPASNNLRYSATKSLLMHWNVFF